MVVFFIKSFLDETNVKDQSELSKETVEAFETARERSRKGIFLRNC